MRREYDSRRIEEIEIGGALKGAVNRGGGTSRDAGNDILGAGAGLEIRCISCAQIKSAETLK